MNKSVIRLIAYCKKNTGITVCLLPISQKLLLSAEYIIIIQYIHYNSSF